MPLEYLVRPPKIVLDKNPLLLLLHGYGSNKEDLFSFATELPDNYYVIAVQAPHAMQYGSFAWYAIDFDADENKFSDLHQARESRDLILTFISEICATLPVDKADITLAGFSQGAILSLSLALSYPEKIKRVVALSGYLNLEMAREGFEKNDFSSLAVFASHGTLDQVIPVEWARKTPVLLKQYGIATTFKEYPIGHGVSPQNFYDFRNWLLEH